MTYGYLDKEGVAHDNALPDGLKATEVTDPDSSTKKLLVTGTLSDPGIYYIYANATGKKPTEGAVETSYTEKEYAVISVVSQEASDNSTKPLSVETVKELGVTTINFYYDEDGNGTRNGTEKIVSTATVRDGADGKSITITNTETLQNGDIRVTFSDGSNVLVPKGAKGDKGETGEAGAAGQAGKTPVVEVTKGEDGVTTIVLQGIRLTILQIGNPIKVTDGKNGADGNPITITNN